MDLSSLKVFSVVAYILFGPAIIQGALAADPSLTLANSTWIWSPESITPNAPPGDRAFRKTILSPQGKTLQSAEIIIAVDDKFDFYVNGLIAASSPAGLDTWKSASRFVVGLSGTSALFAVNATNLPAVNTTNGTGPAGVIAVASVTYTDGTSDLVTSDSSWKVDKEVDAGFMFPSADDSSWAGAAALGAYGIGPWGTLVAVPSSASSTLIISSSPSSSSATGPTPVQSSVTPTQSNPTSPSSSIPSTSRTGLATITQLSSTLASSTASTAPTSVAANKARASVISGSFVTAGLLCVLVLHSLI